MNFKQKKMEAPLKQKKIAVLVENGFEQVELSSPIDALKNAGADVDIISKGKTVKAWQHNKWGDDFLVDMQLDEAIPDNYDGLVLPGGVMNPDKLRMNPKAVAFVKHFLENNKPIAAICHGPWTLIETGMLKGRKMTSYPSIKTDLINAGVSWVDDEVVVDLGLVTSRRPEDLEAFNKKMIEEFKEGQHGKRVAK